MLYIYMFLIYVYVVKMECGLIYGVYGVVCMGDIRNIGYIYNQVK